MNRTRGFVNQNRFRSSKTIKRLSKIGYDKYRRARKGEVRVKNTKEKFPY